jgi:hypothetical protein
MILGGLGGSCDKGQRREGGCWWRGRSEREAGAWGKAGGDRGGAILKGAQWGGSRGGGSGR